jgi:hypothetical protein
MMTRRKDFMFLSMVSVIRGNDAAAEHWWLTAIDRSLSIKECRRP